MKKLSRKQKLIGGIAIILVAVILAIIITTNIINNNNKVANEGYAATTANAGSSLISNYILNGITIGGITGKMEVLDTSDANATPEDIALGKTAYVKGKKITGTRAEKISNDELQISADNVYYADIDDDGTVYGVIFADLAVGRSGEYGTNGNGTYEIPKEENLKSYYIKNENYIDDSFKKNGKVIAPIKETSGTNRFYVMALEDINSGTNYYWYKAGYGILDDQYSVNYTSNDFAVKGAEPTGRINTNRMIKSWNSSQYGEQNSNDIWGVIQNEVADGWFVPSKSEWAAFGEAFGIDNNNYSSTYGLSYIYWSSSQLFSNNAFGPDFTIGIIDRYYVNNRDGGVRLATTF